MKKKSDDQRVRELEAIIILASASIVFYYVFKKTYFVGISLTLLLISLLAKKATAKIVESWMVVSNKIALINTTILLSLVFWLLLTPMGLLYRLLIKKGIQLEKDLTKKSYFKDRNHAFKGDEFRKTW